MTQPRRLLILAYLAAFAALVSVQIVAFRAVEPVVQEHRFVDPDSYTWMGRVQRLREGVPWYDQTEARSNWPFGERVHYERPFDVVLLAGAASLAPLLGPAEGLYWWGVAVSPVLLLGVAIALAWGTSTLLGIWQGPLAVLLLTSQYAVLNYALPGLADHHLLIMLLFVLTWALVSGVLRDPASQRRALLAGGVAGLGLWVSLEFMLMLVACHGALAVNWIRRGGGAGRAAVSFSLGVLAVAVIGLVAEHPPAALLVPEYDRLSIVQVLVMTMAAAFWIAVTRVDRMGSQPGGAVERLKLSLWSAGIALGSIGLAFPQFILSPLLDADPKALAVLGAVGELMPLWSADRAGLFEVLLSLGVGLLAVPGLIYLLVRERAAARHGEWMFLAIAIAIYLPLALAIARFAPYAELLMVIVAAEVLARLVETIRYRSPGWPAGLAAGTVGLALLVTSFFATSILYNSAGVRGPCASRLKPLAEFLTNLGAAQGKAFTLAAMPDAGPELLYRTPHRVIATPNRSNEQGAIAIYDLLMAEDDEVPKRIVRERGIDLFVVCTRYPAQNPFFARLLEGRGPDWVGRVPLPPVLDGHYALFVTRR